MRRAATVEQALRHGVEIGTELRERRHFTILSELALDLASDLLGGFVCADEPTRDTERPTFTAGRMPWKNRSVSRKIWPSVIEITLVGI